MLFDVFQVKTKEELPLKKVEYVFDIFTDSQDFLFDDQDEINSNLLLLTACLYSAKKREKICFISPNFHCLSQVDQRRLYYLKDLKAPDEAIFPVVIPEMQIFNECVQKSSVVFMHGQDFSKFLPEGWNGRKIIQIFPGKDIPIDAVWLPKVSYNCS